MVKGLPDIDKVWAQALCKRICFVNKKQQVSKMKGWWRIEEDEISWMWMEGVRRKLMSWLETPDPVQPLPLLIKEVRGRNAWRTGMTMSMIRMEDRVRTGKVKKPGNKPFYSATAKGFQETSMLPRFEQLRESSRVQNLQKEQEVQSKSKQTNKNLAQG